MFILIGSGDMNAIPQEGSKVLLKGMRYTELEVCFSPYYLFVEAIFLVLF